MPSSLTRYTGTPIYYSSLAIPVNATTTVLNFGSALPTTLNQLDEMFVYIGYRRSLSQVNINAPSGWTLWGSTPADITAGGSGASRAGLIYHRRSDGTAQDTPVITATHSAASPASTRAVNITGIMWLYRGFKLGKVAAGYVGGGPPTFAFTYTSPRDGLFIGAAYQSDTNDLISLATGDGYDTVVNYDPPGSASSGAPQIAVVDSFVLDEGVYNGPTWNVYDGSSGPAEAHDCWVLAHRIAGFVRGNRRIGEGALGFSRGTQGRP